MLIDYYKRNVVVEMAVYVLRVYQVEKFVNVSMDLLDYFVNHPFVSFNG